MELCLNSGRNVSAEGSADALADFIRSVGGSVKFKYRNVPAVAASIPIGELANVGAFSGVTKVEKDRMMYLTDQLEDGKNAATPVSPGSDALNILTPSPRPTKSASRTSRR